MALSRAARFGSISRSSLGHCCHVQGKQLTPTLDGYPPVSEAYYRGRLGAGSVVRAEPSAHAAVLLNGTERESIEVDLCGVQSLDRTTWGSWVAVVVPAYGLGWVEASSISRTQKCNPSLCQLSGLRLLASPSCSPRNGTGSQLAPDCLQQFISSIGANLTFLDVSTCGELTAASLERLAAACPSLRSLVVTHCGDVTGLLNSNPKLSEVSLTLPPSVRQIKRSVKNRFDNLTNMRICAANAEALGASSAFLRCLLDSAPRLRYLHWQDTSAAPSGLHAPQSPPKFE